ncbi:response regulator [Parvicella tangerina]|uniref:Sensor histidine kinase RcsC n=1 Tax=Parvicella tangerina TaxID=2829795 RepID=A0A916JP36_9FLAO|nr:response regulator [Parvicella tangerina]CAG5084677.1 Sensor histidine kinase RcsC [Parvicella tangerina]
MQSLNRIMLVDDDSDTNYFNQYILDEEGIADNIVVFQHAIKALDYLKEGNEKVDLILLDINMPVMNGWEFLQEYEQLDDQLKATIVVVMLTSSVNYEDKKRADQLKSIDKFVNKPLTPELVTEILALF